MGKRDPRVDAYIAKSADFAQPILKELRDRVHAACPDVEEAMKWSFPHFMYQGMLCSMAAFKAHAAFGFWKGRLVVGDAANRDALKTNKKAQQFSPDSRRAAAATTSSGSPRQRPARLAPAG